MLRFTPDDFVELNRIALKNTPHEKCRVANQQSLDSVVNQPHQIIFGEAICPTDLDKIIYTYWLLVKKHCFANGNKRTAYLYLVLTLQMIGYKLPKSFDPVDFSVEVAKLPNSDESIDRVKHRIKYFIGVT